jgi:hypothetical protein
MPLKVILRIVMNENARGEKIEYIESIKKPEDEVCYIFPPEFQARHHHPQLFSLPIVKEAASSLTKVGHRRNITLTMDDTTAASYTDTDLNFVFRDNHLEESKIIPTRKTKTETEKLSLHIERLLEILRKRDKHDIEGTDFAITQFNGTQKARDWILKYETECEKYGIRNDEEKIKNLRKYLKKTASEWYQTNLLKDKEYNWEDWKAAFLKAFSNKGWSAVRYAYNFRYVSGSFVEYAIKKERLILEVRRKTPEEIRINLIVIGLPIYIQDKIDREAVRSTNDLIELLGQYEDQIKRKKIQERNVRFERKSDSPHKEQPCVICETSSFPGQFHPVELCRNRNGNAQRNLKQVNSLKLFTSEDKKAITPDENKMKLKRRKCESVIELRVRINDQKQVKGVYDTGATVSTINQKIIDQIKADITKDKIIFKTIIGKGFANSRAKLRIKINKIEEEIDVYIISNDNYTDDLILGLDAIRKFKLKQDENLRVSQKVGDKEEIIFDKEEERSNDKRRKLNGTEYRETDNPMDNLEHLNNLKKELRQLIEKCKDVLAKHKFDVETRKSQEASIKLTENRYMSEKPHRCSIPDQNTKLLERNLIEESSSPFAAPVTRAFEKESNRRDRLCIDFRETNKFVAPESQPFSRIRDITDKAENSNLFSTFDMNSVSWSVIKKSRTKRRQPSQHKMNTSNGNFWCLN